MVTDEAFAVGVCTAKTQLPLKPAEDSEGVDDDDEFWKTPSTANFVGMSGSKYCGKNSTWPASCRCPTHSTRPATSDVTLLKCVSSSNSIGGQQHRMSHVRTQSRKELKAVLNHDYVCAVHIMHTALSCTYYLRCPSARESTSMELKCASSMSTSHVTPP